MDNNNNKILSYDDDGYDELTMRGVVKNSTVTNEIGSAQGFWRWVKNKDQVKFLIYHKDLPKQTTTKKQQYLTPALRLYRIRQ
jgi:hypothetical protein